MADLVVVDLSIPYPNVWYKLGLRHRLHVRGVIQIRSKRERRAFDISTDRTLSYNLKDAWPDPAFIDEDKSLLEEMARDTVSSWQARRISPVYNHLKYLREPDWKSLRIDDAKEFWDKHETWKNLFELLKKSKDQAISLF